jgi:hypothetical protein
MRLCHGNSDPVGRDRRQAAEIRLKSDQAPILVSGERYDDR